MVTLLLIGSFWLQAATLQQLMNEHHYSKVADQCEKLRVGGGNTPEDQSACLWAYLRTSKLAQAEKLLAGLQKDVPFETKLATIYIDILGGKDEKAREQLDQMIAEYKGKPGELSAQELLAEFYELRNRKDAAAFLYKQVVARDPARATSHWGLGRYYYQMSDVVRARGHLEKVAFYWRSHAESRFMLGAIALQNEQVDIAAKWFTQSYQLNKKDPRLLEQIGIVFEKKNRIESALKMWKRALALDKDAKIAKQKYQQYSESTIDRMLEQKKFEAVIARIELLGPLKELEPKFLLKHAIALRQLNRNEEAQADLAVYLNAKPNDAKALEESGVCFLNQERYPEALDRFARAIEQEPQNGLFYSWLAFTLEAKGDSMEAYQQWKRATEYLKDPVAMKKAQQHLQNLERKIASEEKARQAKEKAEQEE